LSFPSNVRSEKPIPSSDAMPLSPDQEALCERLENGESTPTAATLIRQQAHEIDDLWDRLSRAYALVRNESPSEMVQEEMKEIHAMLEGRRNSQLGPAAHLSKIGQGKTKGEES
jgi:rubrerythrin